MLAFIIYFEIEELKESAALTIIFKGCLNKYIIFQFDYGYLDF